MGKQYIGKGNQTILYLLEKRNLTKTDLGRLLKVSPPTLHTYMNNPFIMRLEQLILVSGMFGMPVEQFIYLLIRNKEKIKLKSDKDRMRGIISTGDTLLSAFTDL